MYSRIFLSADMNSLCFSGLTTYVSIMNTGILTPLFLVFCYSVAVDLMV